MKKGIVPSPDIDTDAKGGYSHTKKGYLDITTSNIDSSSKDCSTYISADVTTANVPDNRVYIPLTSSSFSSAFSLPYLLYMIADPGYDDKKLYEYSKKELGIDLVCPVERYKSKPKESEFVCFYHSVLGQAIYNLRRISIEPLIEHIKSVFRINSLPARGFHKVSAIVILSDLLYQIMVYYNCKTDKINPKSIKYMLGTGY